MEYFSSEFLQQIPQINHNHHSLFQEIILKRAADLAEALYSMPRNQLSLPAPQATTMNSSSAFNSYTGQLSVNVKDTANGQWDEGWSHRYPAMAF